MSPNTRDRFASTPIRSSTTNSNDDDDSLIQLFIPPSSADEVDLERSSQQQQQQQNHEKQRESHLLVDEASRLVSSGSSSGDAGTKRAGVPFASTSTILKFFGCVRIDPGSTLLGSLVFLLYQIVFCLAQGSTITRPHADHSSTGVMAQWAALGALTVGPSFVWAFSPQIPAVYPASDLFLAPFLAQMAVAVDRELFQEGLQNNDTVFLATFGLLMALGMFLSATLCWTAARIKLANLGNFLPFPVLAGFFTTIGILMWTLGVAVDTGAKVQDVVAQALAGEWSLVQRALLHHLPSLAMGIIMHKTSHIHSFVVMFWILMTGVISYAILWMTDTTLEQAQREQWFFSLQDLQGNPPPESEQGNFVMTTSYGPPWPGGVWVSAFQGHVHWPAFVAGLPNVLALTVLYLIRCSLHSTAIKKNIPNVTRAKPHLPPPTPAEKRETRRKLSLNYILEHGYAYGHWVASLVGAISVAPSLGAAITLFQLGADEAPPQYLSCLLLLFLYFTDFSIVQYIPKPAFSSLMVLSGLDMCSAWLVQSYFKTPNKWEWCVAPLLVSLAFTWGLLDAIFIGVAISTFLFVGSFYKAGTVKAVSNGLTMRSTVERGFDHVAWLDQKGDLTQVLVLHSYLFFGNIQAVSNYVNTMFEEDEGDTNPGDKEEFHNAQHNGGTTTMEESKVYIPPIPQHLILDFTLVTGMDTSAVDLLHEILKQCRQHKCKLYLAGMANHMRNLLLYTQRMITADKIQEQCDWYNFTIDLNAALAKAEDALLSNNFYLEAKDREETNLRRHDRSHSAGQDDGFHYALEQLKRQHRTIDSDLSNGIDQLVGLADYTTAVELEAGDVLTTTDGLYFVETGLLRIGKKSGHSSSSSGNFVHGGHNDGMHQNHDTYGATLDSQTLSSSMTYPESHFFTLDGKDAHSQTLGRPIGLLTSKNNENGDNGDTLRFACIGHGSVIGSPYPTTGSGSRAASTSGGSVYVALSACRLHFLPASMLLSPDMEYRNPVLLLHLYKVLAYLSSKREERTIRQLRQTVRILQAPTPRLRRGKLDLGRLQQQE